MNEQIARLRSNIELRIVGKEQVIDNLITAMLAGGHVLLEDVPGVGKTSLARSLSDSLSLSFARIQCTPDTMPADITGFSMYDPARAEFKVVHGPVINNVVLADELNRTSPKTQSALLEVMEERKVTIDGNDISVPLPFMVIATQNPSNMAGTYPVPESSLDRFMMKLSVGYPDSKASENMAMRFLNGELHDRTEPVLSVQDIIVMQDNVRKVAVHDNLRAMAVKVVDETRCKTEIACGASPRALLSLLRCSQALAYINDRDYCIPEDISKAAMLTLPHRLVLSAEGRMNRADSNYIIRKILEKIKV
ncbi:MAG: MoxR family ATPase [Butyrivibrio sp.]|nr:MoxR family ATPase [Butyrivibrio sp.]